MKTCLPSNFRQGTTAARIYTAQKMACIEASVAALFVTHKHGKRLHAHLMISCGALIKLEVGHKKGLW